MSRPIKTSQGSNTLPQNRSPSMVRGSPSTARDSPSVPHTSQSPPPKASHSTSHGGQSMPRGEHQPTPSGPQSSMQRGHQSMQDGYYPYGGGYGGYSLPPHGGGGGGHPMGYGGPPPPPMSHTGFRMSPDRQPMPRGVYPMYGGSTPNPMSQENKNRMKTFSKSQRENLSREGAKTGTAHQRGAVPETANRMTMDYKGRIIDSRGRIVDQSRDVESSTGHRDDRCMYGRDVPREERAMYDYAMPGYMYGNMMEDPEYMFDMEIPGRYPPFYAQYSDEDYNYGMMGNMMPGYMDGSGRHDADFPGMHFPENRRLDSAGRYGDSFDR